MIKSVFSAAFLLLALFLFQTASLAQEQRDSTLRDRNSLERFNEAANQHSEPFLFKALQFDAPYSGFYQLLSLDKNGNAFTARVVVDWAVQASSHVKLDDSSFTQIRQALTHLSLDTDSSSAEPQPGQQYTAFVFYDGKVFKRYDFNGALPLPLQEILDFIRAELEKGAKLRHKEFLKHQQLMLQLYGDWQNKSGVTVVSANRMHTLKKVRGLLLTLTGQRKQVPPADPAQVSIYHALVFYPEGALQGSGSGGSWSDDPISSQLIMWNVTKESGQGETKTEKKELEIKHHALDGTISIEGKIFQLAAGNLFVIRMSENWTPTVSQIGVSLDEQATEQKVLDRFKEVLTNQESIRQLELN